MVHCTLAPVANWELCKVHDLPCHDKVKKLWDTRTINNAMSGCRNVTSKRERERKNIFALKGKGRSNSNRCVSSGSDTKEFEWSLEGNRNSNRDRTSRKSALLEMATILKEVLKSKVTERFTSIYFAACFHFVNVTFSK